CMKLCGMQATNIHTNTAARIEVSRDMPVDLAKRNRVGFDTGCSLDSFSASRHGIIFCARHRTAESTHKLEIRVNAFIGQKIDHEATRFMAFRSNLCRPFHTELADQRLVIGPNIATGKPAVTTGSTKAKLFPLENLNLAPGSRQIKCSAKARITGANDGHIAVRLDGTLSDASRRGGLPPVGRILVSHF